MRPESSTGLYWSNRGTVLCREHAFQQADQEWMDERWRPLPDSSQGIHGIYYQCQQCALNGNAIVRAPSVLDRLKTG